MWSPAVQSKIESFFRKKILSVARISGGDINDAYLIKTAIGSFFIKMNAKPYALQMFEAEAKGLNLLRQPNVIKIPEVIYYGIAGNTAFLVLEHIETGAPQRDFWENFATRLAQVHQQTNDQFGLDHENFIGDLFQPNNYQSNWSDFFVHERLLPQIHLAENAHLLPSSTKKDFQILFKKIGSICPAESPSLIHGDLWNGNFMTGKDGVAVLIDPSVSFSHREMDLAMARLFGGFDQRFYQTYDQVFPLQPGFEDRFEIYQLYYLMVHVNLFGSGYLPAVNRILKRFV